MYKRAATQTLCASNIFCQDGCISKKGCKKLTRTRTVLVMSSVTTPSTMAKVNVPISLHAREETVQQQQQHHAPAQVTRAWTYRNP